MDGQTETKKTEKISPCGDAIGHRPLRGRCPKRNRKKKKKRKKKEKRKYSNGKKKEKEKKKKRKKKWNKKKNSIAFESKRKRKLSDRLLDERYRKFLARYILDLKRSNAFLFIIPFKICFRLRLTYFSEKRLKNVFNEYVNIFKIRETLPKVF